MSCNNLTISVHGGAWEIDITQVNPRHGNVVNKSATQVTLSNTGYYGPDCVVGFLKKGTTDVAVVDFQQNYCAMKAGDIAVNPVSGPKPQVVVTGGSWSGGSGGNVAVNGFA